MSDYIEKFEKKQFDDIDKRVMLNSDTVTSHVDITEFREYVRHKKGPLSIIDRKIIQTYFKQMPYYQLEERLKVISGKEKDKFQEAEFSILYPLLNDE